MPEAPHPLDTLTDQITQLAHQAVDTINRANEDINIENGVEKMIEGARKILEGILKNNEAKEALPGSEEETLVDLIESLIADSNVQQDVKMDLWKLESRNGTRVVFLPIQIPQGESGQYESAEIRIEFGDEMKEGKQIFSPRDIRIVFKNGEKSLALGVKKTSDGIENAMARGRWEALQVNGMSGKKIGAQYPFNIPEGHDLVAPVVALIEHMKGLEVDEKRKLEMQVHTLRTNANELGQKAVEAQKVASEAASQARSAMADHAKLLQRIKEGEARLAEME